MNTGDVLTEFQSGDPARGEQASQALINSDSGLEEIRALLDDPHPDVRWWATRALAGFQKEEAGQLLIKQLNDPDASIRQCAALALSQRPVARAVPGLVNALKSEDALLKRLAADALVNVGTEATLQLVEILESADQATQVEAARALALMGDQRSIPALFKLAENDSVILQHWANEGLEKMGIGMAFFKP